MVTSSAHGSHQVWAEIAAGRYEQAVHLLCSMRPADAGTGGFDDDDIGRICDASGIAEALFGLGVALWAQDGQELLAIDVFRCAANAGSKLAMAALGDALQWFGDDEHAVEWLERGVRNEETDSSWLHGLLGEALYRLGRDPRRALDELAIGYADHDEFGLTLARLMESLGQFSGARSILERLVVSRIFGAAIRLGNLLQDHMDDIAGAKRAYRTGMETGDGHSAYNLGLLYWSEGNETGARDAFAAARSLGDLTPTPYEQG